MLDLAEKVISSLSRKPHNEEIVEKSLEVVVSESLEEGAERHEKKGKDSSKEIYEAILRRIQNEPSSDSESENCLSQGENTVKEKNDKKKNDETAEYAFHFYKCRNEDGCFSSPSKDNPDKSDAQNDSDNVHNVDPLSIQDAENIIPFSQF